MKLLLVFLVFQCFETTVGGNDVAEPLVYNDNFSWNKSCLYHPIANSPGNFSNSMVDGAPVLTCDLTFDYDTKLDSNSEPDKIEATEFCKHQFPDKLISWQSNSSHLVCNYRRHRFCKNQTEAIVMGNKCVFLLKNAYKRAEAAQQCKAAGGEDATILSSNHRYIANFLMRIYKWDQPTKAIWYNLKQSPNEPNVMYTDYGAIGSNRPGQIVKVTDKDMKASVVCIREAEGIPGEKQKALFCEMLKVFLKIKTYQNKDTNLDGTCYYITPSLMQGKQAHGTKKEKLVTVDHFHSKCMNRDNNRDKKYAVFPSSKFQKEALKHLIGTGNHGRDLLLAGAQEEYWGRVPKENHDETVDTIKYSMFSYTRLKSKQTNKNKVLETESAGCPAHLWKTGYPMDASAQNPNWGAMVWSKDETMTNVFNYRRAPIACATGIQMAEFYECPTVADGEVPWQLVERPEEKKAFCMKAFHGTCKEKKAAYEDNKSNCAQYKNNEKNGFLAVADSDEEFAAISAAVRALFGGPLIYKSVLLGGYWAGPEKGFVWEYDSKQIKYGWVHSQPDQAFRRDCGDGTLGAVLDTGNRIISAGSNLFGGGDTSIGCDEYRDNGVALRFNMNGHSEGLIDVVRKDPCLSIGYWDIINKIMFAYSSPTNVVAHVCAVEAKKILTIG